MLKKFVAAVAAVVFISGCAVEAEPSPSTQEDRFIAEMQERSDTFSNGHRDNLIDAGNAVCDYFADFGTNHSSTMLLMDTLASDFGPREAAVVIAVSVENLCPEFEEPIRDALEGPTRAT